jgi:hypothetical protein
VSDLHEAYKKHVELMAKKHEQAADQVEHMGLTLDLLGIALAGLRRQLNQFSADNLMRELAAEAEDPHAIHGGIGV